MVNLSLAANASVFQEVDEHLAMMRAKHTSFSDTSLCRGKDRSAVVCHKPAPRCATTQSGRSEWRWRSGGGRKEFGHSTGRTAQSARELR